MAPFGGFGGSAGMTNSGILTVIEGDIGTTGVATVITGFHDSANTYSETGGNMGSVTGTIFTAPPPPGTAARLLIAQNALADATVAYNTLRGLAGQPTVPELGGRTLAPGVYSSGGLFQISGGVIGNLTLDGNGDPNAMWVFQSTSLTIGNGVSAGSVLLINGAQAKNVYWVPASAATINGIVGGGVMQGTVIAPAGVTVSTAGQTNIVTINGRIISLGAATTVNNAIINLPK